MKNSFNENAIREAAYYIWKNNGCPANTSAQDWNAAINQLSAYASLSNNSKTASGCKKASACKTTAALKKSTTLKSGSAKKTLKKSK